MKEEFQVGEIAKICNVERSTVIRWIKKGKLKGYQTAGGRNRVYREHLIEFMNEQGYPINYLYDRINTRVLIVENEPAIEKILREAIEREPDFEVYSTFDVYEAGILTQKIKPDVMILDIKLEGADGRNICKTLRMDAELRHIKVIGISGKISPEEGARLTRDGFDEYFEKPFDIHKLVNKIKKMTDKAIH